MSASIPPRQRLRDRMMVVFAAFTLVLAALFGLYTLLFVYTVEDQLFDTLLEREAATQRDHYAAHGRWSPPRNGFMSVVERHDDLPDGIGRVRAFIDREREFTRDASHELRTPLTVIRAASERLSADTALSADARASVEHIGQSASHLEQTVALLLALAREQPAPPTASTPVTRVIPVLERVVVEQSPLLEGKHVQVVVEVPADVTSTLTAPVLQVLLSNLIGNAFAHTREGDVVIMADEDTLCVSNPGHAVREGDFAPFVKGEDSTGFGLGLSIVRRLCERHAIDLRFESSADGSSARLRLRQDASG